MELLGYSPWQWFELTEHELLLFAATFFLIGSLDDLAVDLTWAWLKLTGRARSGSVADDEPIGTDLAGKAAVFISAWREDAVIGHTVAHILSAWPHADLVVYVGCYANDPATAQAAQTAARGDSRLRIVVNERAGPTTKADCLNRIYEALKEDERRSGERYAMVAIHDAEDMVHPLALSLLDRARCAGADFIQLPVLPEPQPDSQWIGSHYCEEFAEAHAKAMVVRDALGVGLPSAGVGCAIDRNFLERLARQKDRGSPFAADCLTEDYELGLGLHAIGARSRFLRVRDHEGRLVATRAFFPSRLDEAVRQKTRWVHGIALQGWGRMGWSSRPAETWMRLRDRRGPLAALVLIVAYLMLVITTLGWLVSLAVDREPAPLQPLLSILLVLNFASFAWRAASRFAFTAREYGYGQGGRAVLRIPIANVIAIMAGSRAVMAYLRSLGGAQPLWDKTDHRTHPAMFGSREA